jgi:predicted Zn finger-like uncharacterized protein
MFTVCPKCALTLVVTAADLRVAQGYVRCGRCSSVFNALAQLSDERGAAAAGEIEASPGEPEAEAEEPQSSAADDEPEEAATAALAVEESSRIAPAAPHQQPQRSAPPAAEDDEAAPEYTLEFDPETTDAASLFVVAAPSPEWTAATGSFKALVTPEEPPAASAPEPKAQDTDEDFEVELDAALLSDIVQSELVVEKPVLPRETPAPAAAPPEPAAPRPAWHGRPEAPAAATRPAHLASTPAPATSSAPAGTASKAPAEVTGKTPPAAAAATAAPARTAPATPARPAAATPARTTGTAAAPAAAAPDRTPSVAASASGAAATRPAAPALTSTPATADRAPPAPRTPPAAAPAATPAKAAPPVSEPAATPHGDHAGDPQAAAPSGDVAFADFEAVAGATSQPESRPRWQWAAGSVLLVLLLFVQIVNHQRDALATDPRFSGALTALYSALGVQLTPRWDLRAYDVRQLGATVEAGSTGAITVRASIRNGGTRPQPLPLLRVTLQDRFGNRLASRDVQPRDYLPSGKPPAGLLARDQRIDAELAFVDPGASAVGFELDACLPQSGGIICANDTSAR